MCKPTNSTEQNPFSKKLFERSSSNLWTPKVHNRVQKSPQLVLAPATYIQAMLQSC